MPAEARQTYAPVFVVTNIHTCRTVEAWLGRARCDRVRVVVAAVEVAVEDERVRAVHYTVIVAAHTYDELVWVERVSDPVSLRAILTFSQFRNSYFL